MGLTTAADMAQTGQRGPASRSPHGSSFQADLRFERESSIDCQRESAFLVRAARYRQSLYFIANSILDDGERADRAVRNCLRAACRNPARFDSEGAFRSWLIRILIDEAVLLSC